MGLVLRQTIRSVIENPWIVQKSFKKIAEKIEKSNERSRLVRELM